MLLRGNALCVAMTFRGNAWCIVRRFLDWQKSEAGIGGGYLFSGSGYLFFLRKVTAQVLGIIKELPSYLGYLFFSIKEYRKKRNIKRYNA